MASVDLRGLTKRFGALAVVDNVSLRIDHGLLVCLLGPSGCGKTTTLRLIAGFVEPTAGEIRVGDRVVSSPQKTLPPERRNMSMIFQSYALWPHMTVAENVAYGLTLRKLPRAEIAKKVDGILATMYDSRTLHSREAVEILQENFGDLVFDTKIKKTVRYAEAPVKGTSVLKYDPSGSAAQAYRDLAKEVLNGAQAREHA